MDFYTLISQLTDNTWLYQLVLLNFKASLILLMAIFVHRQLNLSSAAHRNFLCMLTFSALTLLPFCSMLVPGIDVPILPENPSSQIQNEVNPHTADLPVSVDAASLDNSLDNTGGISPLWIFAGLYVCVTIALILHLIVGLYRIKRLSQTGRVAQSGVLDNLLADLAESFSIERKVKLIVSSKIDAPITYGIFRPTIIWPDIALNWSASAIKCALSHELAHIKRFDWASLLLARMACILFWLLPMTWIFSRQLDYDAERAADDLVLRHGSKASFYADQLLSLFRVAQRRPQNNIAVVAMLCPRAVFDRIKAIVDVRQNRDSVDRTSIIAYTMPSIFILLAVAAINTTAMTQTSQALEGLWSESLYRVSLLKIEKDHAKTPVVEEVDIKNIKLSASSVGNKPSREADNEVLDTLVVTAIPLEMDFKASEEALVINDFKVPAIQVEGYLPLHTVTPAYPVVAQRKGIEGYVVVRFSIDSQGIPYDIEIVDAAPAKVFDRAVLKAIGESRYSPHSIDRQRVSIKGVTSRILFKLQAPRKPKARAYSMHERSPPLFINTS